MKNTVKKATIIVILLNLICVSFYLVTKSEAALTLTITTGTVMYHFCFRLAVGSLVPCINNCDSKWFAEKSLEKKIYKFLKVNKWKRFFPSYSPETYDVANKSVMDIIKTTCRNEIIHEINILLSFTPILFIAFFNSPAAFILTSVFGGLCDLPFVIIQRYNRPRLKKIQQRMNRKNKN